MMPGGESRAPDPAGEVVAAGTFRALVADYLGRMKHGDDLTDDYVTMVRLFNTIESGRLAERAEIFAQYAAAFFPGQVQPATHRLAAVPTKGMALYSAKHDLYIGGPPHPRSRYRIEGDI